MVPTGYRTLLPTREVGVGPGAGVPWLAVTSHSACSTPALECSGLGFGFCHPAPLPLHELPSTLALLVCLSLGRTLSTATVQMPTRGMVHDPPYRDALEGCPVVDMTMLLNA